MPDFVAGLLVGLFVGGFVGVFIMCLVQAPKLDAPKESQKRGKDQ